MSVGDVCSRDVIVARATESLSTAARLMQMHHVGSVVVYEERNGLRIPVGILTDRDVMLAVLRYGVEFDALLIGQAMSRDPLVLREDEEVDDAVERMRAHAVRRAPVVTRDGVLLGIVSVDDLIDALVTTLNRIVRLIQRQIKTPAAAGLRPSADPSSDSRRSV